MSRLLTRSFVTTLVFVLPVTLIAAASLSPSLSFEANIGQAADSIDFLARGERYTAVLQNGSYALAACGERGVFQAAIN